MLFTKIILLTKLKGSGFLPKEKKDFGLKKKKKGLPEGIGGQVMFGTILYKRMKRVIRARCCGSR